MASRQSIKKSRWVTSALLAPPNKKIKGSHDPSLFWWQQHHSQTLQAQPPFPLACTLQTATMTFGTLIRRGYSTATGARTRPFQVAIDGPSASGKSMTPLDPSVILVLATATQTPH